MSKFNNFKVQEDDIRKFKGFAEANDLNQVEMAKVLLNAFHLEIVKGEILNTAKENQNNFNYELKDYENSFI
jgi:hypothetical protein